MLVAVLSLPSFAFAPTTDVYVGIEPQRIEGRHPHEQLRLAQRSAPLAAFLAAEGAGWRVRWDEATGTPRELWGPGIPMPAGSEAEVSAAVGGFFRARADLLGVDPAHLKPESASYDAGSDTWYVDYDVEREPGVTTYRGGLTARIKHGNLILVRAATAPESPITGRWGIDPTAALALAIEQGPAPRAAHTVESAERRLLERWTPGGLVLRRVIETRTRTEKPPGIWVSFVDADSGELLHVYNEVRFVTGTIAGRVHADNPQGNLTTVPMPLVRVTGSGSTYTDENGDYSVGGSTITANLDGQYLEMRNAAGSNAQLRTSSANPTWDTSDATQAELDTYVYAHEARDWALAVAPDNSMATRGQRANVNINDTCNAYYNGQINFFRAGGGCTNTGENDDVVHHEWGHGFHYAQIRSGVFDGSLSEGAADTVAFFQSGSQYIGPGFFTNGGAIRDVGPDREYPDDFRNSEVFVHDNGLIFGGAIWDLWGELVQANGDARGTAIAQEIYAGLLRGGPTIPESYGEALVADDDDGDLGNGTPHGCEISAAFALHGLGEGAGGTSSVVATHEGKDVVAADEKWTVVFELPPPSDCFSGVADEAVVHYRRGEAEWKDLQARVDGGTVRATMPAFPDGTFVEYWMEGVDVDGNGFSSPSSQRVAAFTTYVGEVLQVACDKLGAEDGGYKGKVLEGTAEDPWQFGAPRGEGGDPARPWSGNNVWGTTLEDDGLYPSNADMRLRTPPIPTKHYTDVFLQYRRWIGVEDTAYDQAGIEVNGQRVWKNSGTSTQTGDTFDDQWVSHSVDLRGAADMGEAVIDFTLQSDDGVEYGGWNIDDVCLLAPNTVDNRLGVGDLRVVDDVDGVLALTWTHPAHEPADRVVLVKRSDRFPESAEDGFVVADLSDFELGSVGTAVDLFPEADNYYAIYGSDGTEWSSFTVEGVNAVHHEGSGTDGLFGFVRQEATGAGCGCDAAGPGGASAVGALVAAGLVARRRRR